MRLGLGIQFHLSLLGVLPAAVIGLALAAYFIATRLSDLDKNLDMRGELILHSLSMAAVPPVAEQDKAALRQLADSLLDEADVLEVSILDRNGDVLALQTKPGAKADLAGQWTRATLITPALPHPAIHVGSPARPLDARSDATALGSVRLVLSRNSTFRQQCDTVLFSLLLLLGGLLAAAQLARQIAQRISQPLMALTHAVHELSKGNLDARAEAEAEAELAYLQAGFNAMAAELQKSRDSLQSQVQQATERLHETLADLGKRNRELEAARWLAESQTELKSQFLAQMSHEIRTPMNGIIGFTELLGKTPLREDQAEKLGLIARSAKTLLTIINEILDLSKLEAGRISLEARPFALRPCLEDIVALLSVREAHPAVALWISPAVPAWIEGDPVRIQQVVTNLLGNALKFTRQGRIVIRVRLWHDRNDEERLLFSVSDSGSGISAQDQAKLFAPFLQVGERAATAEKGAGLGLSIAKNIVERMGGAIRLASRVGKGTTLWFDLPLRRVETPTPPPALALSVGVVETDRIFRGALVAQIQSLGAEAVAFGEAEHFFRHYADAAYPALVLYSVWPARNHNDAALPRWLAWCEARQLKPTLLFPNGERRLVNTYRKRGFTCLFHPLRSEVLTRIAAGAMQTPPPPPTPPPVPVPVSARHRFLLVDDNDINRLLLREQLRGWTADTLEASDGKQALNLLRQQRFDLVFLDLHMPLMSGQAVLQALRGEPGPNRHVPVIAVTAYCAPTQRESMLREGFHECLIKPVTQDQLLALVAALLGEATPAATPAPAAAVADSDENDGDYVLAIVEKCGGDWALADTIARKLFGELPANLRQAELSLRAQDADKARFATHKINGAAAFSGLMAIRHAAAHLEAALLAVPLDWPELNRLGAVLSREVKAFLLAERPVLEQIEQVRNLPDSD